MLNQRKPNRLRNYDYSQGGYYFVTICTQSRIEFFGEIQNGAMVLNENGKIAEKVWIGIPEHFGNVELDEFVVMPNHIHGIIVVKKDIVGNRHACSLQKRQYQTIPVVVGSYKSAVTRNIRKIKSSGSGFVWQKSFYDHIIRDGSSLNRIREYVINNSIQWDTDVENTKSQELINERNSKKIGNYSLSD
jgi:REP element-mobilizing transposase RayT